jgi:hypothetical protein
MQRAPATSGSEAEKISFNQINRSTGHRIKYLKVDADAGEEVPSDEIMKGYKVDIRASLAARWEHRPVGSDDSGNVKFRPVGALLLTICP